jgi:hypothetical protein
VKINPSKIVFNTLFNQSKAKGNSAHRNEALLRAYSLAAKINALNPKIPRSDRLYVKAAVDYYSRVLKASRKHDFVAAYSLCCPVEIFHAMGIVPLQLEVTGWVLTMLTGETNRLLTAAGEAGLAPEICSVHRLITGAFAKQLIPRPDAVVWTNVPCENSAKSGPLLAKINHCPDFFLDHPYEQTPEEVQYLVSEFNSLISFLEEKVRPQAKLQKAGRCCHPI